MSLDPKKEKADKPKEPKVPWWKKLISSAGNAIGEAKFGG
jgi:hypothetical protein